MSFRSSRPAPTRTKKKNPTCTETEHRNPDLLEMNNASFLHTHTHTHTHRGAPHHVSFSARSNAHSQPGKRSVPEPQHQHQLRLTRRHFSRTLTQFLWLRRRFFFPFSPSLITCSVQCLSVQLPGLSDTQVLQPTITVMAGLSHAAASGRG